MKLKIIKAFTDKNTRKNYNAGYIYESNDTARIKELQGKGFLQNKKIPKINAKENYDTVTKKELMQLLKEKGIEYNSRSAKAELIKLLGG